MVVVGFDLPVTIVGTVVFRVVEDVRVGELFTLGIGNTVIGMAVVLVVIAHKAAVGSVLIAVAGFADDLRTGMGEDFILRVRHHAEESFQLAVALGVADSRHLVQVDQFTYHNASTCINGGICLGVTHIHGVTIVKAEGVDV